MTGPAGDLSSPALPGNSGAGSEKKRKTAVFDPLTERWMCRQCLTSGTSKPFRSEQAVWGHTRVHKQQAEGGASSSAVAARRKKIHGALDLKKKAPGVHEEQDEEVVRTLLKLGQLTLNKMKGRETEGDGSAAAEGGASLSAAEPQGKKIKLDLNNVPPEDDERETKVAEGGTSLSGAEVRRKKIHMELDLNKAAPEDDERETKGDGSTVAEGVASLSEAETGRKNIHMKLDLNNYPPEDDEMTKSVLKWRT